MHSGGPFQDGRGASLTKPYRVRRLHGETRLARRIHCTTYSPKFKSVFSLRKLRKKIYQYKALNFGLNVAPQIFSKILRYTIEPLRKQGIRLVYYLDDICLLSQDALELEMIDQRIIKHLESLGFIINRRKSLLIPSHVQEYLGFEFNTKSMKIKVPDLNIRSLLQRLKQALLPTIQSCRWATTLLEKITATLPAVFVKNTTSPEIPLGEPMLTFATGDRGTQEVADISNQEEWITDPQNSTAETRK